MSTVYHPQTDGQSEATNKTLEGYLRCFVRDNPKTWSNQLTMVEYCYNTSYHTSLESTLFEATYGCLPPSLTDYIPGSTNNQAVEEQLQQRTKQIAEIKYNLTKAQERQKRQIDNGRKEIQFKEGEWVYHQLQPFKQSNMPRSKNKKNQHINISGHSKS